MIMTTQLPADTALGVVTLKTADLARARDFYTHVLGMNILTQTEHSVMLGADTPLVQLRQDAHFHAVPRITTGLYHAAILLPSRIDLSHLILHVIEQHYPLQGYADHLVSEAFYLADPDGNGIELYRDRPREQWKLSGDRIEMANAPIDLDEFFGEAQRHPRVWAGLPNETVIGHMHLRIGDADQAVSFYTDVIGFSVMASWHGAGFVSAGGYHHHLGLNHWQSRGAPSAPEHAIGLDSWTIVLSSPHDLLTVKARLDAANIAYASTDSSLTLRDPWGIRLHVVTAPSSE